MVSLSSDKNVFEWICHWQVSPTGAIEFVAATWGSSSAKITSSNSGVLPGYEVEQDGAKYSLLAQQDATVSGPV